MFFFFTSGVLCSECSFTTLTLLIAFLEEEDKKNTLSMCCQVKSNLFVKHIFTSSAVQSALHPKNITQSPIMKHAINVAVCSIPRENWRTLLIVLLTPLSKALQGRSGYGWFMIKSYYFCLSTVSVFCVTLFCENLISFSSYTAL